MAMHYPHPQACFDFHLHTHWSYDATASVKQYFQDAQRLQLRAIAITEHQTMDSWEDIQEAARQFPSVRYVPAAEMTVTCSIGSVDMVCLNLPVPTPPELEAVFARYRKWQCDYGDMLSEFYIKEGIPADREFRHTLLQMYRPRKCIEKQGITHVQNGVWRKTMLLNGWIKNQEELIRLEKKRWDEGYRIPYPEAESVLPLIRKLGGVVFIAHPKGYFKICDQSRMDALREELQFDGIECSHSGFGCEISKFYRSYARKHKLLCTGGSDNHGSPYHVLLGVGGDHHAFAHHPGLPEDLEAILERVTLF
ncbi:MAG: PHP domain-containing protein [Lentisphaerae bacterium]|jgi:predicted metal-dependent phosphoesterase TrpH|nr:PHP domain-containing protein [Lentisphaerota bacterium]